MGLVKTRRLTYPPLVGARPIGKRTRRAERVLSDAEAAAREDGDGCVADEGVLPVSMLPIYN